MHLLFLLLLFPTALALADARNRGVVPFGETEALRGNAGTAGGDSIGAVFYNPAALSALVHPRLAVSGNTYFQYRVETDNYVRVDATDLPFEASGFNAVPSAVISTHALGEWTVAYYALIPESFRIENRVAWTTPNTRISIIQVADRSELWLGGSAARPLGGGLSVGVSLFGIRHTDSATIAMLTRSTSQANTLANNVTFVKSTIYGISLVAGARYEAASWLVIGLRVQAPLWNVSGSANAFTSAQAVDNGNASFNEISDENLTARYALPWDATLGIRWQPIEALAVFVDGSLQAGIEYDPLPGSAFSSTTRLEATPRLNLGASLDLGGGFTANAGAFYNPTASEDSASFDFNRANYYGLTAGVLWNTERTRTGVGAFYLWSRETGPQPGGTGETATLGTRFLGGVLSVAYLL